MEFPIPDVSHIPIAQQILNNTLEMVFPGNNRKSNILRQLVLFEYIDSKGDGGNGTFVVQQMAKLVADIDFHAASGHEATLKAEAKVPLWVYNFDYYCNYVFPPDYPFEKGAIHGHEELFLFGMNKEGCDANEFRRIEEYMGQMWTNFANTGNPSPSGITWPQFNSLTNANTLTIRVDLSVEPLFYTDITRFWYSLIPSIERELNQ